MPAVVTSFVERTMRFALRNLFVRIAYQVNIVRIRRNRGAEAVHPTGLIQERRTFVA